MARELAELIFSQAHAMNEQMLAGMKHAKDDARRDLKPLFEVYDMACHDDAVKIPTKLHLIIEALRKKYAA